MRLWMGGVLLAGLALGGVGTAWGQAPDWAAELAGDWTLGGVYDGDPYCRLTLGTEGAIGGASLDVSATCLRNYPLADAAAWSLRGDDEIVLIDALRQEVLVLQAFGAGDYGADLADGRQVALTRGAPDVPAGLDELLEGTFTLSGPDNAAPCGFMVSASSAKAGTLEQSGACPAAWKDRGWAKWQAESDRLTLEDKDGKPILVLALADGFTFVAEGADGPLYFGPGVIEGE